MRERIKNTPILGPLSMLVNRTIFAPLKAFDGSENYWKQRYRSGGNSGAGSYHELAEFKAEVLNAFVKDHGIETVIEYGCGDGNQLRLAHYPS